MTSPGRPERNRATRSFRQLRRFHHVNSDRVFGTHKQRKPALCQRTRVAGRDNRENRQDAIQLDEEPTIVVCEPDAATQVAPQDNQLVSERGILSLKPDLRLEQRGQHGQDKPASRQLAACSACCRATPRPAAPRASPAGAARRSYLSPL